MHTIYNEIAFDSDFTLNFNWNIGEQFISSQFFFKKHLLYWIFVQISLEKNSPLSLISFDNYFSNIWSVYTAPGSVY